MFSLGSLVCGSDHINGPRVSSQSESVPFRSVPFCSVQFQHSSTLLARIRVIDLLLELLEDLLTLQLLRGGGQALECSASRKIGLANLACIMFWPGRSMETRRRRRR